jgi:ABC-type Fe3+ transport system substrate-binding protein
MPATSTEPLDCTVDQFLRQHPGGRRLLESMGLDLPAAEEADDPIAAYLTLRSRLQQCGADPEAFLRLLCTQQNDPDAAQPPLWIEANVPCALKAPLEIALEQAGAACGNGDVPPRIVVQSENASAITSQGATLESPDAMPDLTMAAGYNTLLDHAFLHRLATAEHFAARARPAVNAALAPYGFADPLGIYRVIGVNIFVFVVDPALARGRAAPDSWEALLTPAFSRDVAVCGMGDRVSGSLMLHVQARFGDDAVRELGRNVRSGMHPSQVIKHLGTGHPSSPAVAVMPWFFARLADIRRPATVVWPRDGAMAMPFFQLVKRGGPASLDRFAAHLEGPEVGRVCSGAFFPSLHPDVPCPLPQEASLAWLGWDYIRQNDLAALRRRASDLYEAGRGEAPA